MSITSTQQRPALAQEAHNFGSALRELVTVARQLTLTLRSGVLRRQGNSARQLTAVEEANQVRAMADGICTSDPRFAQDLYATATRHELADNAC